MLDPQVAQIVGAGITVASTIIIIGCVTENSNSKNKYEIDESIK